MFAPSLLCFQLSLYPLLYHLQPTGFSHHIVQLYGFTGPRRQRDGHCGSCARQEVLQGTTSFSGEPGALGHHHGRVLDSFHLHGLHAGPLDIRSPLLSGGALHAAPVGHRVCLHAHSYWCRPVSAVNFSFHRLRFLRSTPEVRKGDGIKIPRKYAETSLRHRTLEVFGCRVFSSVASSFLVTFHRPKLGEKSKRLFLDQRTMLRERTHKLFRNLNSVENVSKKESVYFISFFVRDGFMPLFQRYQRYQLLNVYTGNSISRSRCIRNIVSASVP